MFFKQALLKLVIKENIFGENIKSGLQDYLIPLAILLLFQSDLYVPTPKLCKKRKERKSLSQGGEGRRRGFDMSR